MIEKVVMDYLNERLPVDVLMEEDGKTRLEYVLIEKTGSGTENHIKSAMFAIQSYSDTLYKAALLNEEVIAAMNEITMLDDVCKSTLNSDYNFTDATKKQYRYQAVFDLVHY